jgi:hypothetical protein
METFDLPENTVSCGRREGSIVPSQALAVLNSQWVTRCAQGVADQISKSSHESAQESPPDQPMNTGREENMVRELYLRILSRNPTAQETAWCTDYLNHRSLAELALVLLNTNELAFVP